MKHLADDFKVVVTSPKSEDTFCYSPGILRANNGRLIASMDFSGPGVRRLEGCAQRWPGDRRYNLGKVFVSDDEGETWTEKASLPLICMRPFKTDRAIYVIGFLRDLGIACSYDNGETWTEVRSLTTDQFWHQGPTNVWYKGDNVYLVMERMTHTKVSWPICSIAPVLMRGNVNSDLTKRENWTFASELVFDENVFEKDLKDFGAPFYNDDNSAFFAGSPSGWLETNVVQLKKENDLLYDKTGKTFHLFMRGWTGLPWTGAMLKVVEKDDGSMETTFETAPSGKRMVFINIPGGGHSKFHILYDEKTKTYWLITNQVTDSMLDFSTISAAEAHGYDRHRLVLYYSYNCFDWLFAGVVAAGENPTRSRSYASMQFDGDDLLVLVRTGDEKARSGHDTNMITFHKVKNFRDLIDE